MDTDDGLTALDELSAYRDIIREGLPAHNVGISRGTAEKILTLAFRALAEKDAEIARRRAELDAASDVPVEYVTEAGLAAAMVADPNRDDGALLRCTDGERRSFAWRAAAGEWEPVP